MNKNLKFRADIEGLRALAVLLVLVYHSGFAKISGGFIGVDIFFVISGFLITTIIHADISNQSFSLKDFYGNRLRRIYPMLILVLTATTVFATFILTPSDLVSYSKSALAAILSSSNLFFWLDDGNYFAQSAEQIPLIHTWSLSVEEQFYLIFPIIMLLCNRLRSSKVSTLIFFTALLGSFGYSTWSSHNSPGSSYYLITSRAFELMIGSALALYWKKLPLLSATTANILRASCIAAIIFGALVLDAKTPFPGVASLIPCLATAAIILSGKSARTSRFDSYWLLSNPAMLYIGKISYSLYLWHWPIVAFVNYKGMSLTISTSLYIIALSFLLSVASYRLVETPTRKLKKLGFAEAVTVFFAIPLVIITTAMVATISTAGFKHRLNAELQDEFSPKNSASTVLKECFNSYKLHNIDECSFGDKNAPVSGMLIGDSMAGHYMEFMDVLAKDAGIKLFGTSSSGLPPFNVKNYPRFKKQRSEEALKYNQKRIQLSYNYDVVFIAASWAADYPYLSENEEEFISAIGEYIDRNKKVVLITRPNTVSDAIVNDTKIKRMDGLNINNLWAPYVDSNRFLRLLKQKYPQIIVIDPNLVICKNKKCIVSIDNKTLYEDHAHLTLSGSRRLGELYLKSKSNPLHSLNP